MAKISVLWSEHSIRQVFMIMLRCTFYFVELSTYTVIPIRRRKETTISREKKLKRETCRKQTEQKPHLLFPNIILSTVGAIMMTMMEHFLTAAAFRWEMVKGFDPMFRHHDSDENRLKQSKSSSYEFFFTKPSSCLNRAKAKGLFGWKDWGEQENVCLFSLCIVQVNRSNNTQTLQIKELKCFIDTFKQRLTPQFHSKRKHFTYF